nr:hypothetical protein [Bradyrhizobium tropiciagri]
MPFARFAESRAQLIDVFCEQLQAPVLQVDREEETASGNKIATVSDHTDRKKK